MTLKRGVRARGVRIGGGVACAVSADRIGPGLPGPSRLKNSRLGLRGAAASAPSGSDSSRGSRPGPLRREEPGGRTERSGLAGSADSPCWGPPRSDPAAALPGRRHAAQGEERLWQCARERRSVAAGQRTRRCGAPASAEPKAGSAWTRRARRTRERRSVPVHCRPRLAGRAGVITVSSGRPNNSQLGLRGAVTPCPRIA